jgi:hypothetical protein
MKKIVVIAGAFLLATLIAAGGFWGGMAYESSRASQARASFIAARGLESDGQFPGFEQTLPGEGSPGFQLPGAIRSGGTIGVVKAVEENVVTISTAQDVTDVRLSESTRIVRSVPGEVSDLQPGTRITVIGEQESEGEINASQITILDEDLPEPSAPIAPDTEP